MTDPKSPDNTPTAPVAGKAAPIDAAGITITDAELDKVTGGYDAVHKHLAGVKYDDVTTTTTSTSSTPTTK